MVTSTLADPIPPYKRVALRLPAAKQTAKEFPRPLSPISRTGCPTCYSPGGDGPTHHTQSTFASPDGLGSPSLAAADPPPAAGCALLFTSGAFLQSAAHSTSVSLLSPGNHTLRSGALPADPLLAACLRGSGLCCRNYEDDWMVVVPSVSAHTYSLLATCRC